MSLLGFLRRLVPKGPRAAFARVDGFFSSLREPGLGSISTVMGKQFLFWSAISGFVSVALGAFGAHALKDSLDEYHLKVFHTGVTYQFYHALALAIVGLLSLREPASYLKNSWYSFLLGTVIFSGSLYLLALTKIKAWGAVTPIGGVSFLLGWIFLAVAIRGMDFGDR